MNEQAMKEGIESITDILTNLRAIKGADFTKMALLATQAKQIAGLLALLPIPEQQRGLIAHLVADLAGESLGWLAGEKNVDLDELMRWADKLLERTFIVRKDGDGDGDGDD